MFEPVVHDEASVRIAHVGQALSTDKTESGSAADKKKMNQELLKLAEVLLVKNYSRIGNGTTKENLLPALKNFLKLQ